MVASVRGQPLVDEPDGFLRRNSSMDLIVGYIPVPHAIVHSLACNPAAPAVNAQSDDQPLVDPREADL